MILLKPFSAQCSLPAILPIKTGWEGAIPSFLANTAWGVWAAAWTCSWRAGLKMLPLAGTPTQKRRQGFKPVAGGEDNWVYGASI